MSAENPITISDSERSPSPVPIPVPAPPVLMRPPSPELPEYDDTEPSLLERMMNWQTIDASSISRVRLAYFIQDSARTMEYLLRTDLVRLNTINEVSTHLYTRVSSLTTPFSYVPISMRPVLGLTRLD